MKLHLKEANENENMLKIENGVLVEADRKISGEVVIPYGVTTIRYNAFAACHSLTSVTIPDSVTEIQEYAFNDCTSLSSITIPDSVTTIGEQAFSSCDSLKSITIPNSVTSIGGYAFAWCPSLSSVTIPSSVTTISEYMFDNCTALTLIKIPNGVTTIRWCAFDNCSSLKSITIPSSVTTIGSNAFANCSSLSSVTIPNGVTTIEGAAFYRCSSLKSVVIPDSVVKLGKRVFADCKQLKSVTMPERLLPVVDGLDDFEGLSNIKINGKPWSSWEFRDELFHIADNVLYEVDLNKIPSNGVLEIPNGVKKIVHSALHFNYNRKSCIVQTLIIPSSVEILEEDSLNWACDLDSTYESQMIKNIIVPKKLVKQLKRAGINYPCTVNGEPWPKRKEPKETIVATYAVSYTDYSSGGTLIIKKKGRKFAWECDGAEESTDFEFNSEHEAYEDAINFLDPDQNSLYLDNQPVFDEENYNEYNEEDYDED